MTRLIVPNYHVILIHLPLALLGVGLLIEIFSLCCRRINTGGRWMILIGALALTPAATSGIFALQDVLSRGTGGNGSWVQLQQSSGLSSFEWELVRDHVMFGAAAAGAALLGVILWLASGDPFVQKMRVSVFLLFIAAMAFAIVGAWHGGELVFREGFGVDGVKGVLAGAPLTHDRKEQIDNLIQPLQIHVIIAGTVFALAAAALGISLRKWVLLTRGDRADEQPVHEAATYLAMPTPSIADDPRPPMVTQRVVETSVPSFSPGRFWLITALITILAVASGLYMMDFFSPPMADKWASIKQQIHDILTVDQRRMGLHIVFGASILALALILAILGRFSPHNGPFFGIVAIVLVLVMAAQVWVGILMLYDGDDGPITHFKREPAASVSPMPMGATVPSTMPATMPSTRP